MIGETGGEAVGGTRPVVAAPSEAALEKIRAMLARVPAFEGTGSRTSRSNPSTLSRTSATS